MTVVFMATQYHELGWAIRRAMSSPGLQVSSQRQLADVLTKGGYPTNQQSVSDYMRNKEVVNKETGEKTIVPRVTPSMEFIAALIFIGQLDEARREDVINAWLEILPDKRRHAVLGLCELLQGMDANSPAWREMLSYERDRHNEYEAGERGHETGGRAS